MALNTAKKGSGLFAGLDNLSNEEAAKAADSIDPKADKNVNPEQTRGRGEATADTGQDPNKQNVSGQPASVAQSGMTPSVQPAFDPSAPAAGSWVPDSDRSSFYNQPGFHQQAQYPPMAMTPPPMYTIDKRYKRKPKSFRTCIALTEELHMEIEAAKRSKRITSLNDLIYSLLCDYFHLEP